MRRYTRFALAVLLYQLAVILWGAFVRATGSGAGCGRHWPLCDGAVVPQLGVAGAAGARLIEFSHRVTSGVAMVLVYVLALAAFKVFPEGHRVRVGAVWAAVLVSFEALIGAGLVLFELVAHDASGKRALSVSLHLGNTLLLLGSLALTTYWSSAAGRPIVFRGRRARVALAVAPLVAMVFVGVTGAIAALGDTLFPARSLREGLAQDVSAHAHLFVRLRGLHPPVAVAAAAVALLSAALLRDASPRARPWCTVAAALVLCQVAAGLLNLAWLAPVGMQLVHLLLADLVWIALVLMAASSLADDAEPARTSLSLSRERDASNVA